MTPRRMVRMVSATEAKNRFGAIIKRAYAGDEHLIVERGGIPVVVIVPIQDYERLIAEEDLTTEIAAGIVQGSHAASSRSRLRAFLASNAQRMPSVPEAEVDQDIQAAIVAVRQAS